MGDLDMLDWNSDNNGNGELCWVQDYILEVELMGFVEEQDLGKSEIFRFQI